MPTLTRGQKISLANSPFRLRAHIQVSAPLTLDFSCFGVDGNGKLSDDRYFVFYNQKEAPGSSVRQVGDSDFELDLDRLPTTIQRLVFVVTVDGQGELHQISLGNFSLWAGSTQIAQFEFRGADFGRERAVMIAEIYRRDGWRLAAVGQGFAGGLDSVLAHFGGQEHKEPSRNAPPIPQPATEVASPQAIACVRCGKSAASWVELRKFDNETGRCSHCTAEVQAALEGLRRDFLEASKSGILQDEAWQAMWRRFDSIRQKITPDEALAFLRPDTIQFVERLLTMAGAEGAVTPASERYVKQMLNAFGIPADLQKPFKTRLQRFKAIAQIRGGYLPVVSSGPLHLDAGELCHLTVPATYRKVTTRSETEIPGTLLATNKRLLFVPISVTGWKMQYKNIIQIKESTESIYLGLSTGSGNGHYKVKDTGHTEAVITTLTLMAKRQLLGPQEVMTRHISHDVRNAVWQRDRGRCTECGAQDYLEFDHIIPYSQGGSNSVNNVQLLCRRCNLAKGDRI
ncbi:general stress protein 16U [Abditibacteriota bacterium]|nr:general stress protein 16U [Abditibacteriota bacterium]